MEKETELSVGSLQVCYQLWCWCLPRCMFLVTRWWVCSCFCSSNSINFVISIW